MVEVQKNECNLPPHFAVNCFPQDGLKYAIFSGPDGLADYRAHRLVEPRPLGTNPYSREATFDTDYLWRAPPPSLGPGGKALTPVHLRPRSSFAGEIGWYQLMLQGQQQPDPPTWTGHQILTSEFRRDLEDLYTHRFQNPWYPGEEETADPAREGAYFRRFPTIGQRARTSHDFRSKSGSHSTGGVTASSYRGRTWRRTPAATPITMYGDDAEVVSVEHSEEGDREVGRHTGGKGSVVFQPHLSPQQQGESSSSGERRTIRSSGSTSSTARRQQFQHS